MDAGPRPEGPEGERPKLSKRTVTDRALKLADAGGLDALTIRKLAQDPRFQDAARGDRGIKWGFVQHLLADNLPATFGQGHEERSEWVYRHGLVRQALDEILGGNGWRADTRAGSQWVFATDRARPRSAAPNPPADRSADDVLGPPPEESPF